MSYNLSVHTYRVFADYVSTPMRENFIFLFVDRTKSLFELIEVSRTVWFIGKSWQGVKMFSKALSNGFWWKRKWAKIVLQKPLKSSKKFSIFFHSFQNKFRDFSFWNFSRFLKRIIQKGSIKISFHRSPSKNIRKIKWFFKKC